MTSSALDVYYQTEWKVKCSTEESFLASWQGLALYSHAMLVVFLPVYMFTAFCILKKTPRSMNSVKWVLLNSHLWCSYVDILICSLITPYFYFPTISGFPVGLLRVLGIPTSTQVYIGVISALFMGTSLIGLFENRSSCIPTNRFGIVRKRTRTIYYLFNCTMTVSYIIPPFLNVPEQVSAKFQLLQEVPCPTEEFFYSEVFVFAVDEFWKSYLWTSTGLMVFGIFVQVSFFAVCCIYYLYLSTSVMISSKTRKYQRAFFVGTIVQAIVPLIFLATPVAGAILSIYLKHYNQEFNNMVVLVFSLHGFASTLVILLVHHPYRSFLLRAIKFDRSSDKNVSTGASYVTREVRMEMRRLSNRVHSTF
ncbi:unnamed protein product [Caenorhabditis sp. 36 PRJEB53466]|nr:unnamed protein product [Caenorhabditis sp. 36 PRJEB53466]